MKPASYSPYLALKVTEDDVFSQFFACGDVLTYGLYLSRRLEDFLKLFWASLFSFSIEHDSLLYTEIYWSRLAPGGLRRSKKYSRGLISMGVSR